MARFDDELIKRLKTETDIVSLIESYGTKLKPRSEASGEMIGLCPIHDDKNPSLVVNRKKNVWNCLGACGKGGDVIEWVMFAEKASFRHAVELLKNDATGSAGGKKFTTERKLESPLADIADEQEAFAHVVNYYHDRLKESPAALDYLRSRGIENSEAIERFRIGFVDRTLGLRLPAKQVKAGREIRERLKSLGIVRDSGHEHFRGCVTFPLFSIEGHIKQLYGRRIDNGQRGAGKHFYLPRSHGGIFNAEALHACDEIILCESVIDALTFWSAGYRNVTTIYGTNGLTDELIDGLKRHHVRRLLIAFDGDDAGHKAIEKHRESFERLGLELFRVPVPPGAKDVNGFAAATREGDSVSDRLGELLRSAQWIGKGMWPGQSKDDFASKTLAAGAEEPSTAAAKEEKAPAAETQPAASEKASSLAAEIPGVSVAGVAVATPQASPQPSAPKEIEAEVKDNGIVIEIGNRTYRVRGLEKNLAFDVLKLNIMARRDEAFYVDTFDLYAAKARAVFIREAARELGFDPEVIKRDLGKVLLKLESLQDKHIEDTLAVKDETIELTDKDKAAALDLLKQPNLIERILADFDACGVVGEETNKLVGYLSATSRKLDKPLAVVIQSSSAAGKSSLMDAVLRFVPQEEQVGYSAMTGQSLFYMGGMNLQHKILSIAEEEGVAQASYALKLLQSEGQLTIASTGKDPGTGRMETQEYHVEGPVMIFLTTTAIDIDEELLNRCVVLTVDENREQTRAIHDQQRKNETLAGLLSSTQSSSVRKLHQNAQRLLRPLHVVNPFADKLDFVDDRARRRRDHMKYLALIRSIALLHQYQRKLKTVSVGDETIQYVEVELTDIVLANRLADQILGRSIDELPPQTRRLLIELHALVAKECEAQKLEQKEYRFTRRFIRERLGWGQTQVKLHVDRLLEMEYIIPHRGGGRRVEYELLYDGRGREGQPTMCGLIDVAKLTSTTDQSSGSNAASSGQSLETSVQDRPVIGASSEPSSNGKPKENPALSR
jgi:DNA primase catalytic core